MSVNLDTKTVLRYGTIIVLMKEIPHPNTFTNKIHGFFVRIDGILNFKINYNDINKIDQFFVMSLIDMNNEEE